METPIENSVAAAHIVAIVCRYYGVTEDQALGPTRIRNLVETRRAIAFTLWRHLGYTDREVGLAINRERSAVTSLQQVTLGMLEISDPRTIRDLREINQIIKRERGHGTFQAQERVHGDDGQKDGQRILH